MARPAATPARSDAVRSHPSTTVGRIASGRPFFPLARANTVIGTSSIDDDRGAHGLIACDGGQTLTPRPRADSGDGRQALAVRLGLGTGRPVHRSMSCAVSSHAGRSSTQRPATKSLAECGRLARHLVAPARVFEHRDDRAARLQLGGRVDDFDLAECGETPIRADRGVPSLRLPMDAAESQERARARRGRSAPRSLLVDARARDRSWPPYSSASASLNDRRRGRPLDPGDGQPQHAIGRRRP